jgi:flagellar basal-body rod protein FlgF
MSDGIYAAASGAIAQERNLAVVANNVANTQTNGYKGDKTIFAEVMAREKSKLPTAPSLRYATVSQLSIDHDTGSLKETGRPLDVAMHGDGYFVVKTDDGERYTRAGSWVLDQQGVLRTPGGLEVMAENIDPTKPGNPVIIPPYTKEVGFDRDGTITLEGQPIARLKMRRFDDPDALLREGLTLFKAQDGQTPQPTASNSGVEQGFLESANVNPVSGLNEMIVLNRSFDALEKVITAPCVTSAAKSKGTNYHDESTQYGCHRHGRAANQCRCHRQQLGQRQHHGLSALARRVRRSDLSDLSHARRQRR